MTTAPLSLPPGIRTLTDPEIDRLNDHYQGIKGKTPERDCPTCRGAGTYQWPLGVQNDCNCRVQFVMHRYFLHSGIGIRYQRLGWDDAVAVNKGVCAKIISYADHAEANANAGRGLILRGESKGTGKTLMAALLLKMLLADHKLDGHFIQFNELLDSHTATWGNNPEAKAWFAKRIRNAGVLVIDDVGRENKNRHEVSSALFDMVIRARHDNCKPTIITTNLSADDLRTGYSSNVTSLLSGICEDIEVPGIDYRPTAEENVAVEIVNDVRRPIVVG